VLATDARGEVRDVTREAFLETGNMEVVVANKSGLMTALRRGEAPILARYEGAYASPTLTVMGDRGGFVWSQPPTYGRIDELVAAKWKRMKILPSGLCSDADFIRRVTLDLAGLPPTVEDTRAFLADPRESRAKREALVDRLIGSPDYVEYWTNKWADLLQVNRKFLDVDGAAALRNWIRGQVAANTPYDAFARSIITASGSNKDNPPAAYFKVLREPPAMMENTTQLFLAVRFNCNKCHDHPFERWTQDQYYQTAAFFAQVGLKADPASGGRMVGGTDVESPKPLYEMVADTGSGEVVHDRTKKVTAPKLPFTCAYKKPPANAPRRVELAAWLTSGDNPYFARSYVNRLWGYLFGVGIIEPLDDIRAGNPPSNPELLDHLGAEFIKSGFNVRHIVRLICTFGCRLSLRRSGGRSGSCQGGSREAAGDMGRRLISARRSGHAPRDRPDDHANRRRRACRLEARRQELRGGGSRDRPGTGPRSHRRDRRRRALARQAGAGNLQDRERQAHALHGRSRSAQATGVQGREGVRAHAHGVRAARNAGQAVRVTPSPRP